MSSLSVASEGIGSPLMTLPNELFIEVASHLGTFKDLNSFLRTTRRCHTILNPDLYRRAVAGHVKVRRGIVSWVLREFRAKSIELLLDNGLYVDEKLFKGETLLQQICKLSNHKRAVRLARRLIQRGADVQSTLSPHGTVLHNAVNAGNHRLTELLLAHGADANATDDTGWTPLHCAVFRDCDAWRDDGYEQFFVKRHYRRLVMGKALLDHGVDPNAVTNNGNTALWEAFRFQDWEVCALLVGRGADISRWKSSERGRLLDGVDQVGKTDYLRSRRYYLKSALPWVHFYTR